MSFRRPLLLALVAGTALLLTSALAMPGPRPSVAPPPPPSTTSPSFDEARADPDAVALFDRALARLDADRLEWIEMGLWQQMTVQGLESEAQGRYLAAPGRRWRLDLQTRCGGTGGTLNVVSDGHSVWQALRVGNRGWVRFSRVELAPVLELLEAPGTPPRVADEFYHDQAFGAVTALLPGLRGRMVWYHQEAMHRDGRVLVKLAGVWTPEAAAALAPAGQPWPAGLARTCRLFLDAETLWPQRLEWWGPDPPRGDEVLLVQAEYRDPVLNRPLSPERCAAEFRPVVDPKRVPDVTGEVTAHLRSRAQQLAAHP